VVGINADAILDVVPEDAVGIDSETVVSCYNMVDSAVAIARDLTPVLECFWVRRVVLEAGLIHTQHRHWSLCTYRELHPSPPPPSSRRRNKPDNMRRNGIVEICVPFRGFSDLFCVFPEEGEGSGGGRIEVVELWAESAVKSVGDVWSSVAVVVRHNVVVHNPVDREIAM